MVTGKAFLDKMNELPEVDIKRELTDEEVTVVSGGFIECTFDNYQMYTQWASQNEVGG